MVCFGCLVDNNIAEVDLVSEGGHSAAQLQVVGKLAESAAVAAFLRCRSAVPLAASVSAAAARRTSAVAVRHTLAASVSAEELPVVDYVHSAFCMRKTR